MQKLLRHDRGAAGGFYGPQAESPGAPAPLLEVLWRRRWTLALTVFACLVCAGLYLVLATKVYRASARVLIEPVEPKVFADNQAMLLQSETYLQTQADVLQSTRVLTRALDAIDYRQTRTFAEVPGDPVVWLRRGGAFEVEVQKKSDVVAISMESVDAREAAALVNGVVAAYVAEQSQQKRSTGDEMLRILNEERREITRKRDAGVAAMLKSQRSNRLLSFGADRGNTVLERTASLSGSLTSAEVVTMDLRAQQASIKAALAKPALLTAFVEAQQFRGRDFGDREYDELRSNLTKTMMDLSTVAAVQGDNNPRVRVNQSVVAALRRRIAEKERTIAEAQLVGVTTQLAAAEEKERQLREALEAHQGRALDLTPAAAEYARLEAEVQRLQKQSELIDNRIAEVSANRSMHTTPLNVQVLEPARAEQRPVKPKKLLALAAAMMAGWVLGIGMALLREWRDARLRTPAEIPALFDTPVIAAVPPINPRLSPMTRGQVVRLDARSPVAEAYRSIRTSLHLGPAGNAKTILVASPMPGDGKSTTASNLAIAFAQAGERTLLVDCDLREPVQHMMFEQHGLVGLTSVVAGEAKLRDAICPTLVPGLHLLPCGPVPESPSEMLAGRKFDLLMRALGESFDRVIIDSPPLTVVTDARILAAAADATLLVVRMNRSMRDSGMQAMEGLAEVGANVVGAIANDVPGGRAYRYYGGSWHYASHARRLPAPAAAAAASPHGLDGNGRTAPPRNVAAAARTEVLTIHEPDWSAEVK